MHTTKQLTEAELIAEIQAIQGGARSVFSGQLGANETGFVNGVNESGIEPQVAPKKRRGRPPGSKNRPKPVAE